MLAVIIYIVAFIVCGMFGAVIADRSPYDSPHPGVAFIFCGAMWPALVPLAIVAGVAWYIGRGATMLARKINSLIP